MANQETLATYDIVMRPIEGHPKDKHLLSMHQFSPEDVDYYIRQASAAEAIINSPPRGIALIPFRELKAVMRQPSTRTGGSLTTAMRKLGGSAELISGMGSSSEAKGETLSDSWVAFATQADVIGTRTSEIFGPHRAAAAIDNAWQAGQLAHNVPVLNLGDGENEHPTQTLGDLYTIYKHYKTFDDLVLTIVGDHERYRAHHSLMIGAYLMQMNVVAVQSDAAKVSAEYIALLGDKLTITEDLDEAMRQTDILYVGRQPDEYEGESAAEKERSSNLKAAFAAWEVNRARLQQMRAGSIVMHPRPRRDELNPDVDQDKRMRDVPQMANMIPMRMAILALHLGFTIPEPS